MCDQLAGDLLHPDLTQPRVQVGLLIGRNSCAKRDLITMVVPTPHHVRCCQMLLQSVVLLAITALDPCQLPAGNSGTNLFGGQQEQSQQKSWQASSSRSGISCYRLHCRTCCSVGCNDAWRSAPALLQVDLQFLSLFSCQHAVHGIDVTL